MAAGRAARRRVERSTAYQQTPLNIADITREILAQTTERWLGFADGTAQKEAYEAFSEIAPIVTRHWSEILERFWKAYTEIPKEGDFLSLQRDLHVFSVAKMNEMMKEVMGTNAFAGAAGDAVESYLKAKIASDRMMEETLKALRIPSRTDIDDLHASIYGLSKKVDELIGMQSHRDDPRPAREKRR